MGIQFNSYLERIWYAFGLHHSHGKLGICKHCGRLFSADKERKSTKVYCSKRCQEAEKDERAKAVLKSVFPGREVVMLDTYYLNLFGGGVHCWTKNVAMPQ